MCTLLKEKRRRLCGLFSVPPFSLDDVDSLRPWRAAGKFFVLDWRNTISCVVDTFMEETMDDVVDKVETWGEALIRRKEQAFESSQYGKGARSSGVRGMLRAASRAFAR